MSETPDRLSASELLSRLRGVSSVIEAGTIWRHTGSGDEVVVTGLSFGEEDTALRVNYFHRAADVMIPWSRRIDRFLARFNKADEA